MDIVIEGKITADDSVAEIVQTIVDLKNVPNAVLRLTSSDGGVQGRVGFGRGGHILGGKINSSDEVGYAAIRKLLTIKDGTYAILDPGRTQMADVNQTLWIDASKVIQMLPNLPESPQVLLHGGDLDIIQANVEKAQLDPMDLKANKERTTDVVNKSDSATRTFDIDRWRHLRLLVLVLVVLGCAAGLVANWEQFSALVPK